MHSYASRNVIWLGLAEGVGRLSTFVILIIAARFLDPQHFAEYLVLFSLSAFAWVIAQMGTGMYGVRALCSPEDRIQDSALISDLTLLRFIIAVVVVSVIFFFREFIVPGVDSITFFAAMAIVFFRAFTLDWTLRAYNLTSNLCKLTLPVALAGIAASYIFLVLSPSPISVFISHAFVGFLLFVGTWVIVIRRVKIHPSFGDFTVSHLAKLFRNTSPIGLAGVSAIASQLLPLFVLNTVAQREEVVIFGGTQRILQLALGVLIVLSLSHFPQLAGTSAEEKHLKRSFQHYLADLLLISLSMYIVLALFSDFIIDLVLGPDYMEGKYLYIIMLGLLPVYFARTAFTDTLIATGRGKAVLWACILGLFSSAAVSYGTLMNVGPDLRVYCAFFALMASEVVIIFTAVLITITGAKAYLIRGVEWRIVASLCIALLAVIIFIIDYQSGYPRWLSWSAGGGLFLFSFILWNRYSSLNGLFKKRKERVTADL